MSNTPCGYCGGNPKAHDECEAELESFRDFVRSLRSFRTKDHFEGRDRGEYGFAWYNQDGAILLHGADALEAWQEFVKMNL